MARRNKPPSRSQAAVAPPAGVHEGEAFYVRVPVSPEHAAAVRQHVDTATRIFGLIGELFAAVGGAADAVDRDVRKLRRARRRKNNG